MRSLLLWNVKIVFKLFGLWNWLCRDHEMTTLHFIVFVDAKSLAPLSFLPLSLSPPLICCLSVFHLCLSVVSLLSAKAPCNNVMFLSFVRIGALSVCWYVKWVTGYWTVHPKMKYIWFFIYSLLVMNCYLALWLSSAVECALAYTSCFHSSLCCVVDTH